MTLSETSTFDEVIDRSNTNSMKWGCAERLLQADQASADPLPMWVADMDFRAPPAVIDALHKAVDDGVYGYPGGGTKSYQDAIINWQKKRFNWQVEADWLVHTSGIITSLKTLAQAFSSPGDTVLIQPPVYAHFHDDMLLNGRQLAMAPLARTETGYEFDAAVFEQAIQPTTKLFIMSNPHNPTGNVWSADELRTMGDICERHGVLVIADEIHQDLIMNPNKKHIPFASLGDKYADNSITCTAPSKTFNLPGLQSATLIIPNPKLHAEFSRQYERNMSSLVNTLGMVAAEAAYTHGEAWLEALLEYIRGNHTYLADAINGATDKIKVLPADSLYLAWIDCRGLGMSAPELENFMLTKARLWLDKGQKFGLEGHGYMRINLGCPRSTVEEAVKRLLSVV